MKRISNTKQEVTQNKKLHKKIQGTKLDTKDEDVQNKRLHKMRSCTEKMKQHRSQTRPIYMAWHCERYNIWKYTKQEGQHKTVNISLRTNKFAFSSDISIFKFPK